MLVIKLERIRETLRQPKWQKSIVGYHMMIAVLSFIAIAITIYSLIQGEQVFEKPIFYWGDLFIVILFNMDYWGGLILSENKKKYFKENIFDLISIVPVNQGFMLFRSFRLIRFFSVLKLFQLVKITAFITILNKSMRKFLKTNGFIYSLVFTVCTILIGSTLIYKVEQGKTIETYLDALWWTFVTTTTVGYGDISPQTTTGRAVAVVLMIVGIGFISMLTGSITTYFVNKISEEQEERRHNQILDKVISDIDGQDLDLSDLSDEQYAQVILFIKFMKDQNAKS
ncbi:MAG: ion transporter [Cellulosilyticaceae bacterium]